MFEQEHVSVQQLLLEQVHGYDLEVAQGDEYEPVELVALELAFLEALTVVLGQQCEQEPKFV